MSQNEQQPDEKDLVINQLSASTGLQLGNLYQQNAKLAVVLAKSQKEVDTLKKENEQLKASQKTDNVVTQVKED